MLVKDVIHNLCAKRATNPAVNKAIKPIPPNNPIAIPPPIAIPSPPLKRVNIEFQWPNIAAQEGIKIKSPSTPIIPETITAKEPLVISKIRTSNADQRPTFLRTLEAPARPVPVENMSIPCLLLILWANGKAPKI